MPRYCRNNCGTQTQRAGRVCVACDTTRWEQIQAMCQGDIISAAARFGVSRGHVRTVRALVARGTLRPPPPPKPAREPALTRYQHWLALYEQGWSYNAIAERENYAVPSIANGVRRARKARQ